MAKKEETKKAVATEVTVENVMDQIKSGNIFKQENVQAALDKIEKEKDEKQQSEIKRMIVDANYENKKKLLHLRSRRREEKITKESLTKSKEILDEALAGKLTPTEYENKKRELENEERKQMRESEETYSKEVAELRNSYEGQFGRWW